MVGCSGTSYMGSMGATRSASPYPIPQILPSSSSRLICSSGLRAGMGSVRTEVAFSAARNCDRCLGALGSGVSPDAAQAPPLVIGQWTGGLIRKACGTYASAMRIALSLVFGWVLCGCGAAGPTNSAEPLANTSSAAPRSGAEQPSSAYAVGDRVVYSYDGSFSERPVVLTEEVVAVEGLQLTITVSVTRGSDELHWIQVVTDTPDNRDNNVIDELYEVVDGERVRLANEGMTDIMRLYAWTLPPCGPPVEPLSAETREVMIAGMQTSCTCERQRMQCDGQTSEMTSCDCPDFVWAHGYGEVTRRDEHLPFWRVRVTGR